MTFSRIEWPFLALIFLSFAACHKPQQHEEHHKILVTTPDIQDVDTVQNYVCQIHSRRHIEIGALEGGYLEEIPVKEGQLVKQGELMFKVVPTLYQAKLASEEAEAQQAEIEFENTKNLFQQRPPIVSRQELALAQAKLAKAQAKVDLARAELNFTEIKAPFDGIIDRLHHQQGSLVEEGDVLTTLSDNSVMWVYFNMPEAGYLDYMRQINQVQQDDGNKDRDDDEEDDDDDDADVDDENNRVEHLANVGKTTDEAAHGVTPSKRGVRDKSQYDLDIDLVLAGDYKFPVKGRIGAIEGEFNNETGNIAFRADFSNPQGLLRHGQTGKVLLHRKVHDAVVIPQRATFEILDKRYVFVIGEDHVAHQREIAISDTLDDIYLIASGLTAKDKIVLEGILQVRDGEKVEYEFLPPRQVLSQLKFKAE